MTAGFRSRPWIGLDLGSFSVKLVSAQGGMGGPRYRFAEARLPAEAVGPGRAATPEAVASAISEAMAEARISARFLRGISTAISGPSVVLKQITLPLLDDSEAASALRFEARKHLPFDPQSMVIDWQALARHPSEQRMDVLLAAVSREHLDRHLAPLRLVGLEPDVVDAGPLALANAVLRLAEARSGAHVALDIGHTTSHLVIVQRGQPFFARRFEFGGDNLERAVRAAVESVSTPHLEKAARGSPGPGAADSPEGRAVRDSLARELIEELRRSFAFYRTLAPLPEPAGIRLTGGAARRPALATALSEALGAPVLLLDPAEPGDGSPGARAPEGGPQFAQAFGLALRTA